MPDLGSIVGAILALLVSPIFLFFSTDRMNVCYLALSLVLAYFVVAYSLKKIPSVKEFFRHCFPKDVYTHPSAKMDYWFVYSHGILKPLWVIALFAPSLYLTFWLAGKVELVFAQLHIAPIAHPGILVGIAICSVTAILAYDFALFFAHYLHHKLPILWEIHKVHHSAEVLTPMTVVRQHPLDEGLAMAFVGIFQGLALGVVKSLFGGPMDPAMLFGQNLANFAFYSWAYHLRHSHVWFDYGAKLDHVFISPAQHQIHHSVERKHWDKNMGFVFAFWDYLFGTLYVPKEKEQIVFGLNPEGEHKEYDRLWKLYLLPFVKMKNLVAQQPLAALRQFAIVGAVIGVVLLPVCAKFIPGQTVFMEDLTSPEVQQLIASGYTTVLVPTGGTEQGGAHVVLGKHNYVVKEACKEIAQRLGHTLVAPVLPFSCAGEITPPTAHMQFVGTISVDEKTFESMLEAEARSLKQHGFKTICFIGDHGGAIDPQKLVADKLSSEWAADHVVAMNVPDYYGNNGQSLELVMNGYGVKDIGKHVGIRDTSELMFVHPDGVRKDKLALNHAPEGVSAADGDARKASADIGQKLLELKVRAATQQILERLK